MTIQISIDPSNKREQKYKGINLQFNSNISKLIFDSVKTMLEKDRFDLFNTRNKLLLEQKIKKSNKEIDSLLEIKVKANNQKLILVNKLTELQNKNQNELKSLRSLVEASAS